MVWKKVLPILRCAWLIWRFAAGGFRGLFVWLELNLGSWYVGAGLRFHIARARLAGSGHRHRWESLRLDGLLSAFSVPLKPDW